MRSQNRQVSSVMTAAITADMRTAPATYCRISLKFLAPNDCATGMAKPAHAPLQKPMMRNMTDVDAPTPARAFTPTKRPTTAASMMRYICWSI